MPDIANIAGSFGSSRASLPPRPQAAERPAEAAAPIRHGRASDAVEISADAKRLGGIQGGTDRHPDLEKVGRVRAEIAAGVYDSSARLETAVDRMISGVA